MPSRYFITAIGTDVGKTVVSALLCQALQADYWKPVQAGNLDGSDSDTVRSLISNKLSVVHPESFRLKTPCSPHLAAKFDGREINLTDIRMPATENTLIVEGAGGIYVPLNEHQTVGDLISHFNLPVILVSRNYLGSINHTLLTISELRRRAIPIELLVFSGEANPESEKIIIKMSEIEQKRVLSVPEFGRVDSDSIKKCGDEIREKLNELLR